MEILFKSRKHEKIFSSREVLLRKYCSDRAKKLIRMSKLMDAENLDVFYPPYKMPDRCHELHGNRKYQLYRLAFTPVNDSIHLNNGNLDWKKVTAVIILSVEDTYE